MPSVFERAVDGLVRARSRGGFAATPDGTAEPEPTALAAIALDDDEAHAWLLAAQHDDGSFGLRAGTVVSDSATALCALALPDGEARRRALDYVAGHPAERVSFDEVVPRNVEFSGWGWTLGTAGWVEPTARVVLAMRRLRPSMASVIDQGIGYLADGECQGGGWNHGNRLVFDVALPPYGETTAVALMALQSSQVTELIQRGVTALRRLWPLERGPLTLATSLAAFRLLGLPDTAEVEAALDAALTREGSSSDAVALAWAAIATGPGLASLMVPA